MLNLTHKPEYLNPLASDELVVETEETTAERRQVVSHCSALGQTVHQLVLSSVPHEGELYEPADHHRLVHPERGHQELGGLGQVDHEGEDEGRYREEGGHPECIGDL